MPNATFAPADALADRFASPRVRESPGCAGRSLCPACEDRLDRECCGGTRQLRVPRPAYHFRA